jgi:RHS repeat-associated protein
MSYMLEDHQGGVSAITSNAGVVDIDESFSAFGTRRNPTTWSGAPTTSDLNTIASLSRQGYTFQTWLGQSMGLNHMNGRVQDPLLGGFLSPDPHITDPTNAQSYNRYKYVNNNPLTYWDPTGFKCLKKCTVGDDDDDDDDDDTGCGSNDCIAPVGCGIPPFAPCPRDPTPPLDANPPLYSPPLPWLDPNLSKCLQSLVFCNFPTQSQNPNTPMTPCPSGLVADVEYGLIQMGQNAVTTGKVAVAGGAGVALIAAPFSLTPPGAAAEGYAAITVAAGGGTALTGYSMQLLAGSALAFQGDLGPLDSLFASTLNLNVPGVPNITPTNPFGSNLSSQAGASGCKSP